MEPTRSQALGSKGVERGSRKAKRLLDEKGGVKTNFTHLEQRFWKWRGGTGSHLHTMAQLSEDLWGLVPGFPKGTRTYKFSVWQVA